MKDADAMKLMTTFQQRNGCIIFEEKVSKWLEAQTAAASVK